MMWPPPLPVRLPGWEDYTSLGDDEVLGLIEHSYDRVKAKLSKAERARLDQQKGGG